MQLSVYQEGYFKIDRNLSLGLLGEAVYSNQKLQPNYTATLLQLPAFTPTIHSKTTFNKAFRSNQYVAVGVKPVWFIYKQLQLRGGLYGFLPLQNIEQIDRNIMRVSSVDKNFEFKRPDCIAELAFVLRIKSLSLSAFGNYYSAPEGNFNFGFNLGFLLFNRNLIEK
jgi:NTE family protein